MFDSSLTIGRGQAQARLRRMVVGQAEGILWIQKSNAIWILK